ncbi:RNA-binding cell elongation regulator Jag/EloR [Corticicoccus populi]|uniref:RNA-binding protein KhpB n=1 Tax=Corticicoccus populi TaxID=1812821 RepID=A0ABW5X100_9STAP
MYKIYRAETVDSAIKKGLNELKVSEADIRIDVEDRGSKGFLGIGRKEAVVKLTVINPELKLYESIDALILRDNSEAEDTVEEPANAVDDSETVSESIQETPPAEAVNAETVNNEENESADTNITAGEVQETEELEVPEESLTIEGAAESTTAYIERVVRDMKIESQADFTIEGKEIWIELESSLAAKLIGKRGQTLNALQELAQNYFNSIYKSYGSVVLDIEDYREKRRETLENLAVNMSKKALRTNEPVKMEPMPSFERKIMHNVLSNLENINTRSEGKDPRRYIVIEKR